VKNNYDVVSNSKYVVLGHLWRCVNRAVSQDAWRWSRCNSRRLWNWA